jgi:predicted GNAT family acetyltransferase
VVGVPPLPGAGGAHSGAGVVELLVHTGAWAGFDHDRVVFKAEIGATTADVCQVQGVWVDPSLRGRGIGTSGTAAVVEQARARIAPVVSLYVNDFNLPARRAYEKIGFSQVATFASILF